MTITKIAGDFAYSAPGTILVTAHNSPIPGYLKCNGATINRTTYKKLFDVIGTTYGSGDGSTTFNIPDFRGTFLRDLDESKNYDIGRSLGTYQADQLLSHSHSGLRNTPMGGTGFPGNQGVFSTTYGSSVGYSGGTETRPRNVAMIFHISF